MSVHSLGPLKVLSIKILKLSFWFPLFGNVLFLYMWHLKIYLCFGMDMIIEIKIAKAQRQNAITIMLRSNQ